MKVFRLPLLSIPFFFNTVFAAGFSDNFSKNTLNNHSRYALFGHGVSVQNGSLRLQANDQENPFINFLPVLGKNSQMSFSARVTQKEDRAALMIYADWRYRNAGPYIGIYILMDSRNYVTFFNGASGGATYNFEEGKSYRFLVSRKNNQLSLSIEDEVVLEAQLPQKGNDVHSLAEENDYGGFALALAKDPGYKIIEIDDLKISGDPSKVNYFAKSQKFSIGKVKNYLFSVIYRQGYEHWAQNQIAESIPFIQDMAIVYGVEPIQKVLGTTQAFGAYFEAGNGFNSNGINIQKGALDHKERGWGLNCHEMGHNWQHLYSKRWNTEGSADLACFLHYEKNGYIWHTLNMLPEEKHRQAIADGQLGANLYIDNDADFNFSGMPTEALAVAGYKARVFTYLLYRVLGASQYTKLHQRAWKDKVAMDSRAILKYAEEVSGKNLNSIFQGWVFAGKSKFSLADTVKDSDGDGLSDFDEQLYGSNKNKTDSDGDGFGDYGEIMAGYNPADGRSKPAGGIIIDGNSQDWQNLTILATDGDEGKTDGDIEWIKGYRDDQSGILYLAIGYHRPFGSDSKSREEAFITLDLHPQIDFDIDYRINVFYGKNQAGGFRTSGNNIYGKIWKPENWQGVGVHISQKANYETAKGFLELAIPLKDFCSFWSETDFYISITGKDEWVEKSPLKVEKITTDSGTKKSYFRPTVRLGN